jgi:hypothetical protein
LNLTEPHRAVSAFSLICWETKEKRALRRLALATLWAF